MSQHDFNIANQSFPATRTDLNNALAALASNSSGDSEPSTTYANQWWYETDTNILKIRNEANNGWVSVITLDASMTAAASELNQLDAITRGSILYGNASGETARLAKGGAGTVLTSDGTDISWAAAGGGVPAGAVIYHAANTPPTGFIKANGAAVSRSTYSDLFTAIGTTFGVGDGSSTFNVPDLRGEFMRGWDDSRGIDSGRSFGSAQADELKSHTHPIVGRTSITAASANVGGVGGTTISTSSASGATGGTETRGRNIALLACIKH
tara:strand:+ start:14902 stop:15705 length:804 start_codon:yes stop_codon:yes gene_type:complete